MNKRKTIPTFQSFLVAVLLVGTAAIYRSALAVVELSERRAQFVSSVTHELKTPLTNIRGYLEALNDGVLPPDPATLTLLQDETLRLAELVEDVLSLARADAASGKLQPTGIDLTSMVEDTMATFLPAINKRALTVDLDASSAPATSGGSSMRTSSPSPVAASRRQRCSNSP